MSHAVLRWGILAALLAGSVAAAVPGAAANPLYDPTPKAPEAVDETHRVTFGDAMTSFTLDSTFVIHELLFPQIGSRSAEDIRSTIGLYQPMLEEALVQAVRESLAKSFPNARIEVKITGRDLGRSNGDLDPYRPGIVYKTQSKVALTSAYFFGQDVPNLDLEELILGTFRMGGTFVANFRLAPRPGHHVNLAVSVPKWLVVETPDRDGLFRTTADNRSGELQVRAIALRVHVPDLGARLARFDGSGGDVKVKVDMHDADVPLDAVSGGEGSLAIDVDVDLKLHHLAMTDDLKGILPPFIEMGHANADYLRLAVKNGLILEQPFADSLVRLVEWNLKYVLGEGATVTVDRATLDRSLRASYDPEEMAAEDPVRLLATARVVKKVPLLKDGQASPSAAAGLLDAVTVRLAPHTYVVKSFYTWDTEYTFLFPGGMDAQVSDALERGSRRQVDGRDAYRLTLTGGEYDEVTIGGTLGLMFFAQAVVGADTPAQTGLVLLVGVLAALGVSMAIAWRVRQARRFRAALRAAPRTVIWGPSGAPLPAPAVTARRGGRAGALAPVVGKLARAAAPRSRNTPGRQTLAGAR